MSAQDLGVLTQVLPTDQSHAQEVNASISFRWRTSQLIRTLSPNNPHNFDSIAGLLYVPELPAASPCDNATRSLIPTNVTTRADIPAGDWPLFALAPWTEPNCVLSYLSVIRDDEAIGALFFHPGTGTDQPPPDSDPSWSLQDGGQWKTNNGYPVYAIPGVVGTSLLTELAQYSGNMSQAPYGQELIEMYNPQDSVRLVAQMDITSSSSGIPSLWVFLIIVLAVLLLVVLITSIIMHMIQRKQRRRLQSRVANGEVDLEALGIRRLNVPRDIVNELPQYTYPTKVEQGQAVHAEPDQTTDPKEKTVVNGVTRGLAIHEVHFSQPTCAICLEDFVGGETTVRELPCNHIFHPECIDPFLVNNSSLCPMCKKSVLPVGYCPVQVTNLMVRRERLIRRTRHRSASERLPSSTAHRLPASVAALNRTARRISTPLAHRSNPYGSAGGGHGAGSEMHSIPVLHETHLDDEIPAEVRVQGVSARRAWRREQLARQQARTYDEHASEARALDVSRPLWRRILGRIFPRLE